MNPQTNIPIQSDSGQQQPSSKSSPKSYMDLNFQEFKKLNDGQPYSDYSSFPFQSGHPNQFGANVSSSSPVGGESFSYSTGGRQLWEIEYYSKYFNIDTTDVLMRMKSALFPIRKSEGLNVRRANGEFFDLMSDRPDLYGPFWIPTSVLFCMFITGSLADALLGHNIGDGENFTSSRGLSRLGNLSLAAFVLYAILVLWPALAWLTMKFWAGSEDPTYQYQKISFLQWLCIYGYCLTILLPYSILAVIVVPFASPSFIFLWQWLLILTAFCISSYFLLINLYPYMGQLLQNSGRDHRGFLLVLLVGLHALLFLLFKLLFY